jgi:hypothetical protein
MDQVPEVKVPPPHVTAHLGYLFDQLKFMKQQQWAITNYGVLILAAIYAIKLPYLNHVQSWLKGLAFVTALAGSGLLLRIQDDMAKVRRRLDTLLKTYFTEDELKGVGHTDKQISVLREGEQVSCWCRIWKWCYGMDFTVPLMAVLWVGAVFIVWGAL